MKKSKMGRYLSRYLAGDHVQVWNELRRLPPLMPRPASVPLLQPLDDFPDVHQALFEDAWQVSLETMQRVRKNLETIAHRLSEDGYRFYDYRGKTLRPLTKPDSSALAFIDRLDHEFGPLPLSLKAFIAIIGDVCFLGNHPSWDIEFPQQGFSTFVFDPASAKATGTAATQEVIWYPDPIVVEFQYSRYAGSVDSVMKYYREVFEMWGENVAASGPPGLEFAADEAHKAGYSGGSPYRLVVPAKGVDSLVILDVKGKMQFVDYLRYAILEWGGFPGFGRAPEGSDNGVIDRLKSGLIDF